MRARTSPWRASSPTSRIRRSRQRERRTASVVPAKAGTHEHEWCILREGGGHGFPLARERPEQVAMTSLSLTERLRLPQSGRKRVLAAVRVAAVLALVAAAVATPGFLTA